MIFRYGAILAIAALSAMPAAAAPFHHPFGEWREYNRDWLAACPDAIDEDATDYYGVSCFASTGSQELNSAGLPAYKLTILRNRLTGDLDLAFTVAADAVETDTSRPLLLAFGHEPPERLSFAIDLETRYNTVNQFYVADPARKAALIEQMGERNAVVVTVPLIGGDTKEVRLSLRGVLASLDFMASHARKLAQY
ncbi:MAG: hypothetical protein ACK4G5_01070 [Devosia sp.]